MQLNTQLILALIGIALFVVILLVVVLAVLLDCRKNTMVLKTVNDALSGKLDALNAAVKTALVDDPAEVERFDNLMTSFDTTTQAIKEGKFPDAGGGS